MSRTSDAHERNPHFERKVFAFNESVPQMPNYYLEQEHSLFRHYQSVYRLSKIWTANFRCVQCLALKASGQNVGRID